MPSALRTLLLSLTVALGAHAHGQTAPVNSGIGFTPNGPCTPYPAAPGICGDQQPGSSAAVFTFYTSTGQKVTLDQLIQALTLGTGPQGPAGPPGSPGIAVGCKVTYNNQCPKGSGVNQNGCVLTITAVSCPQ